MVRMPGSSNSEEDASVKIEPEAPLSTDPGSPSTYEQATRPVERQVPGGVPDDHNQEDLEEKLPAPHVAPKGAPAGSTAKSNPPRKSSKPNARDASRSKSSTKSTPPRATSKVANGDSARKKLRAPATEGRSTPSTTDEAWRPELDLELEYAFRRQELFMFLEANPILNLLQIHLLSDIQGPISTPQPFATKLDGVRAILRVLKDAGFVTGAFDAHEVFEFSQDEISAASERLQALLVPLVGQRATSASPRSARRSADSSPYQTGVSVAASDSSDNIQRMTLGPKASSMLATRRAVSVSRAQESKPSASPAKVPANVSMAADHGVTDMMQRFMSFMAREQQQYSPPVPVGAREPSDVEMESAHGEEYDPDDIADGLLSHNVRSVATAATLGAIPRVRMSAVSDLKEFSGKEGDEERARAWLSKVKTAFGRDQANDMERCLVFSDLLTGPARNWHRQLSRSTRNSWNDLQEQFQVRFCGRGVSAARQYYHARRRSEESPLEYLYRLNVAGLRAKIKVKDGPADTCREHVEHFIATLEDQELADRLIPLRLVDADALEEVLDAMQRAKAGYKKHGAGSKFRQKPPPPVAPKPTATSRAVRAVRVAASDSESSGEESGLTSDEGDLRHVYLASIDPPPESIVAQDRLSNGRHEDRAGQSKQTEEKFPSGHQIEKSRTGRCSHCGSLKHTDLGCWKRLTCQKCGKRGHPSDRCLFVCRGCGDLHDIGSCPMEEFYNLVRQWYDPSKHAGMLPSDAEKMLN